RDAEPRRELALEPLDLGALGQVAGAHDARHALGVLRAHRRPRARDHWSDARGAGAFRGSAKPQRVRRARRASATRRAVDTSRPRPANTRRLIRGEPLLIPARDQLKDSGAVGPTGTPRRT